MIKICHLISTCMKHNGPGAIILAQVLNQDREVFRSSVWSLYPPPAELDPYIELESAGVYHHAFSMSSLFLDIRVLFPLVRQLRRDRPDVLQCHLLRANLYGRVAARLAGIPVVICVLHNVEDYMIGQDPISHAIRQFERLTNGWVSKYVAVSEGVRVAAIKYFELDPNFVVTVSNAVDLSPFRELHGERAQVRNELGLHQNALVVGSVGGLIPRKNFGFLVDLARDICSKFDNIQFVIVGDGSERSTLEEKIAEQNLQGKVILSGFRSDIPRILQALDIFVLPSLNEGLPCALMEAMADGLPCVVSNVGGNAEAIVHGETGYVVTVNDYAGFASALTRLLSDSGLRNKMGRASRERAFDVFNPARMAKQYAELYRSLLSL